MLELPSAEVRPDRIRQSDRRVVYGRRRNDRWAGGRLVFFLPDRTPSHSHSPKSP
jgi:hypothetical protein